MRFSDLAHYRRLGINITELAVMTYLQEHGETPYGVVAKVLDVSERTVQRAVAACKAAGLSLKATALSHDHAPITKTKEIGTATELSGLATFPDTSAAQELTPEQQKRLDRLVAAGCAETYATWAVTHRPLAVIDNQIAGLEYRAIKDGWKPTCPGRFLIAAIKKDSPLPDDLWAVVNRARDGVQLVEPQRIAEPVAAPAAPQPVAEIVPMPQSHASVGAYARGVGTAPKPEPDAKAGALAELRFMNSRAATSQLSDRSVARVRELVALHDFDLYRIGMPGLATALMKAGSSAI